MNVPDARIDFIKSAFNFIFILHFSSNLIFNASYLLLENIGKMTIEHVKNGAKSYSFYLEFAAEPSKKWKKECETKYFKIEIVPLTTCSLVSERELNVVTVFAIAEVCE